MAFAGDWGFFGPGGSNDLAFSLTFAPIPEPSAVLLFGVGALIVGVALRKKAVA